MKQKRSCRKWGLNGMGWEREIEVKKENFIRRGEKGNEERERIYEKGLVV
ncbi:hypothetical protein TanjilG_31749 [Lupinus angustifolius]|uniref:Uncharacterized protein n=1 Tax=Lupinus angustifolius TaxID=3871 RepID=A0A4P1RMG4_LUPAN|nr:hypothetical protein TanjilG_31749 [Lupinus angustifolius]